MSRFINGGKDQVKVTIIDTHFIQTDARSFKSVVQSLTGKDSTVTSSSPCANGGIRSNPTVGPSSVAAAAASAAVDVDFQELQRMIMALPPAYSGEFISNTPLAVEDYGYYS